MIPPLPIWALWQFGSLGMLAWGLAAALPILIHLWSRRTYREEPWAAMAFLIAALRKSARRRQLEQWLLLAVRTAILLLFAVALADPRSAAQLGSASDEPPRGATHVLMVIDGSFSLDARQQGRSRFAAAKEHATALVAAGQPGDGYTLLLLGEPPRKVIAQPTLDTAAVLTEIDNLELTHAGANLPATLAEVDSILIQAAERQPHLTVARVCIITDLQHTTWSEVTSPDCRERLARIEKLAALELMDVGEPRLDNWAVTRLTLDQPLVAAHTETQIEADIQSFSRGDQPRLSAQLLVDGERIADERVAVPALGSATIHVQHRFDVPGEHLVEIRLGDDPLPLDNRRWLSVRVAPAIRVLCIGGRPGETRHLALALNPLPERGGPIEVVEAPESRLIAEDLAQFDCVFVCNIGRFSRDEARLLDRYARAGGGVVIFAGDQVQADNYNELLAAKDPAGLLPARLGEPAATGNYPLDPLEYRHPIVAPFRGFERAGLLTTPVWSYLRTTPAANAQMALGFQNGDAAIVERSVGRGRCVLVTTSASPDSLDRTASPPTPWSALATWPSFPPLTHEILRFAIAGRSENRNLLVGESLAGTLPLASAVAQTATLTAPGGTSQRLSIGSDDAAARYVFDETARSGVYEVRIADEVRRFAVNVDGRESDLARFEPELLPAALRRDEEPLAGGSDPTAVRSPQAKFRWLLAAVLALLLAEPCLAWQMARGRT